MHIAPTRSGGVLHRPLVLLLFWAGAVAVVALVVGRFWIPLDDGTLAQSAERVLRGELPHRDFGDPYTGLNAMLGAVAFKLFGIRLFALRIPLVVAFALWLPAVWLLARRFVGSGVALTATGMAATLSVLAYPAAMPTWFALFMVTWGTWFLVNALEGGGRGWLLTVGVTAGAAVLFKVVGLYFLAAALFSVAWHRADGSRGYAVVTATGVAAFLLLLGRLVLPNGGWATAYHFFLPAAALCLLLMVRVWPRPTARTITSANTAEGGGSADLLLDAATLFLGAVLAVGLFLVPYLLSASVPAWVEGVFLMPGRRFESASSPPGAAWTVLPGLVAVGLAVAAARLSEGAERGVAIFLAALLAFALYRDDAMDGRVMETLWYSLRGWTPALVLWSVLVFFGNDGRDQRSRPGSPNAGGTAAISLLAVAALWTLVQFPYTAPAYFFYVAPLGVLATVGAAGLGLLRAGPVLALLSAVYLFLGAGYVTGVVTSVTSPLASERGGIVVSADDAVLYGAITEVVSANVGNGALWAGPDAPEVYFLTGMPNPTPTLYEFLDPEPRTAADWTRLFRDEGVRVAVVNTRPLFSKPLDPSSMAAVESTFPESRTVGHFVVRWRQP